MNWNGWIAERCIASSPHYVRVLFMGIFFRDLINLLLYVKRPHYSKQSAVYVLSLFLRSDQWLMLIADIHCPSSAKVLCDEYSILRENCSISSSRAKKI